MKCFKYVLLCFTPVQSLKLSQSFLSNRVCKPLCGGFKCPPGTHCLDDECQKGEMIELPVSTNICHSINCVIPSFRLRKSCNLKSLKVTMYAGTRESETKKSKKEKGREGGMTYRRKCKMRGKD